MRQPWNPEQELMKRPGYWGRGSWEAALRPRLPYPGLSQPQRELRPPRDPGRVWEGTFEMAL